jgi:hypothetical protein
VQQFLTSHETVVPLVLVAVVAASLLAGPVGRRTGRPRWATGLLLLACLLPLALTVGPRLPLDLEAGHGCVSYVRPYRWWGQGGEEVANALLLLPVGCSPPCCWARGARSRCSSRRRASRGRSSSPSTCCRGWAGSATSRTCSSTGQGWWPARRSGPGWPC